MSTLNFTHHPQTDQADCLSACAKMVLESLGIKIRYGRIKRTLKVRDNVGASFYNLRYLGNIKAPISINILDGDMDLLEQYLHDDSPVIVAVNTIALPYWDSESEAVDHAVVVAGIDATTVSIYDPWFMEAPKLVKKIDFESAWLYREYAMAVITKTR